MSESQTPESVEPPVEEPEATEGIEPIDPTEAVEGREVAPASLVTGLRRTRRRLWIAVAAGVPVALLVVVFATRPSASTRQVRSPLLGKPAPAAESVTIDGERVSLADLKGRWVVVNFFATWCVPCRIEHSELVRFSEAHAAAGDASVFAVIFSDSTQAVKEFRDDEGGNWPMVVDPKGSIALNFGVSGVPESFLVDPDGVVRSRILGGVRAVDLDRLLAEARAKG